MKKINVLLILMLMLVFVACAPQENNKETEGDVHMNYLRGIILEVRENKTIVIEVTSAPDKSELTKNVVVTYDKFDGYETKPTVGDEISTSYWDKDVTHNEDYDYIKVTEVALYTTK